MEVFSHRINTAVVRINTAIIAAHEWTVTVMIKLLLAFIVGANFGALVIALVKGGDG